MAWVYLIIASIFEVGWIISLKETNGFTRVVPMIFYALFGGSSAYFFSLALRSIPMATAYSVWMGIAVIGSTIVSYYFFKEPYKLMTIFYFVLIMIGITGLKFSKM